MSAGRKSGSIVFAMIRTVISGTPRTNSMKITEAKLHDRQLRAPPEGQENAERQREDDADGRDEQRDEDAAPERRRNFLQRPSQDAPRQEEEGEDREGEKK